MPLDAICLSAVTDELSKRITGMKIDKIQQPERDIIILSLRGTGYSCRLLISAGTGDARIHLTESQFDNPKTPPMFCMLLRKHLVGARIIGIKQIPSERIVNIVLSAPDLLGIVTEKNLIIELIGRISNIILTSEENLIIDCMRRVGGEMTDKRMVLPGLLYALPPSQEGKADPMVLSVNEWKSVFSSRIEKTADVFLLNSFIALSPLICREISWRAYGDACFSESAITDGGEALCKEFFALIHAAESGEAEPWSLSASNGTFKDFSFTRILQYENAVSVTKWNSFSEMLDDHFTKTAQIARMRSKASATLKTVNNLRDRTVRKLAAQQDDLSKAKTRSTLRENGDIITANLHLMKKGQSLLVAQDFYGSEDSVREIVLDPLKNPQQNAARYYKDYNKAKTAEKVLIEQIKQGELEIGYFESVIAAINMAEGEDDLQNIRNELTDAGYLKAARPMKEKRKESPLRRFKSTNGFHILVGRNNVHNDHLTFKTALKTDVWLHAQKHHGAHVVIACENKEPDDLTLHEAAAIAAYYSEARNSGKTPVDYTYVKQVKKPPASKPGMAIYSDYKTIMAIPDEKMVNSLREGR